jgi:NAD(P)-dependent dehydrogenase (short-subunit alcohol dehydrogenase family)
MSTFENKVVLITGGGTGIGKATAASFMEEGAKVVIVGRRASVLEATVKELGESAQFVVGDVGKSGDPKAIVDEVIKRHGRLDVVVNNAGTLTMGPIIELDDEEVERVFRTNVFSILAMSRESLPHLIKTKGSIINISSTLSTSVMPGVSVYAASKAAVDHITKTLAVESGPSGVRVNAVAPGLTATDMPAEASPDGQMQEMMVSQTPMGRIGEPQDIARIVRLLASDDAGWVTGQIVQVSGGLML